LEVPSDATVVRKGTDRHRDAYSAFHGRDHSTSEGLDTLLRQAAVDEILLCGLATDYCVLHTALDARAHGYEVTVVESACRGIDADGSLAAAWSRMTAAGVRRTWTAPS
ncbi:MAG: isochorismatase family protein, partial [Planctomycetia bacterium]